MRIVMLAASMLALIGACAPLAAAQGEAQPQSQPVTGPSQASAPILGAEGQSIGTITLRQGAGGVLIDVEVQAGALSPGWHGMHFHQIGTCSDAGFKASGAHVGHGETRQHGLLNPQGPEAGDLPNLFAPDAGPARAQAFTSLVRLLPGPGAVAPLLDGDGAAFVIHASLDDHTSQPIGGAGARVACAALQADAAL